MRNSYIQQNGVEEKAGAAGRETAAQKEQYQQQLESHISRVRNVHIAKTRFLDLIGNFHKNDKKQPESKPGERAVKSEKTKRKSLLNQANVQETQLVQAAAPSS